MKQRGSLALGLQIKTGNCLMDWISRRFTMCKYKKKCLCTKISCRFLSLTISEIQLWNWWMR